MKLLVATEFPPDAAGGGAAIVRQMLQGFPGEISWWSVNPAKSKEFEGVGIVKSYCGFPPGKLMPQKRFSRLKSWLMAHVWTPIAARDFKRTLEIEQPDCVWVIPHNWSILPIYRVLIGGKASEAKSGKVRRHEGRKGPRWEGWFHVTIQDYPDVHNHSAVWGKGICTRLNREQDELYRLAVTRDATSLPMLDDLKKRTGADGLQMLHQGLEKEDFEFLERSDVNNQRPEIRDQWAAISNQQSTILRIAYAGTILVHDEFAAFVSGLSQLRKTVPMELHLWGSHSYKLASWFDPDWVIEHGNLSQRELLSAIRQCDWGFIPMSLKDQDPRYNRFSFPTKFITYLAAGLPIIILGHQESSVMKMAEDYDVGFNLSNFESESLQSLGAALSDPDAKSRYRGEILRCAKEQFNVDKTRRKLWAVFETRKQKNDHLPLTENHE